jgi:F420-dependent oxidoreductase-like protein
VRIAIKTNPQHTTWKALREMWVVADGIEVFDTAWSFDHFYPIVSDSTGPCLEGWTTLAALAEATERLRVGLLVSGMPYRHPAVLANMASAVDIVSDGRLELGLGAGWNEEEASAYGIDLGQSLTERFDRFDEGVEAVLGLLTDETTTFHGKYVDLTEARNSPKAIQSPRPPLTIGGTGEKRTLRTVARFADHWNLPWGTIDDWNHKRGVLAAHCAAIGRDPSEILNSTMLRVDADDLGALAEDAQRWYEAGLGMVIFLLSPPYDPALLDSLATLADPLRS